MFRRLLPLTLLVYILASPASSQEPPRSPLDASGAASLAPLAQDKYRFASFRAGKGMVVSAEPLASQIGVDVLKEGGNAIDAAVATAFALAVTFPEAGNIGGGGFMLIRSPEGQVAALDFRELAPAKAYRDMFLDSHGDRDADKATVGALCVGVPGTVAGLTEALHRYGTKSLARLVQPARHLAANGFPVSTNLSNECFRIREKLGRFPSTASIFLPHGSAVPPGELLRQPDLAWSLQQIEARGRQGFYEGPLAERLAAAVVRHGGLISVKDLAGYRPLWRTPLHSRYHDFTIWSMPPPSSGGVHLLQILNVLSGFELSKDGQNSAANLHRYVETFRQAYADRSRWLGDPDFVNVPVGWLISDSYAKTIRDSISPAKARRSVDTAPGAGPRASRYESPQTTHFCVVDSQGWAVSCTYTLNFSFGSGMVAEGTGVVLNDEMDDFSAAPGKPNGFGLLGGEANAIVPFKRPLSSMAPTIVEREGKLVAVLGSPGGSRIITIVLQVLLNMLDFDLNAQSAVSATRVHHQWFPDIVEYEEGLGADTIALMRSWGHNMVRVDSFGDATVIHVLPDGSLEAGADPRRFSASAAGY